jgi:HNH endonuclease
MREEDGRLVLESVYDLVEAAYAVSQMPREYLDDLLEDSDWTSWSLWEFALRQNPGMGRRWANLPERSYEVRPSEARPQRRKRPISHRKRWVVWERDNFTCRECGSRRDLSVDHVYPEALGGGDDLDNLQTLCCSCNSRKGVRL